MAKLYVVTDEGLSNGLSHTQIAELSCKGGTDIVQLRDKIADDATFARYAREVKRVCDRYGAWFIVNDRFDIALETEATGAHLGQSDMSIADARARAPEGFVLGCSVGSVEEALKAEADGADYVALSPVFDTKSKSDADPGHGLEMLSAIKSAVKIPVYAIGGINKDNAGSVVDAGADAICVISAVVSQKDPAEAAASLKRIIA
ncbi:MAG: thiamine phosphate synthase [Candidatus Methanomethylophilaceae archaeon]|nr:thiamine phosphate synthase [Candidatus Methanomethylophilaceae archaeon]MDY5871822.1 thiamine phosphate synthase [Candidatus Methanomethylophilaceae archaeon]